MNTIIKEVGIVILILIAIALILGVIFYDYIPNNKTVPLEIQPYALPEDIKEELQEEFTEEQKIVKTYYIDNTDLNAYESSNDYDKGKANPFADYSETSTTTNTASGNNTNINSNNTGANNNTVNTNNTENFSNKPVK